MYLEATAVYLEIMKPISLFHYVLNQDWTSDFIRVFVGFFSFMF